MNIFGILTMIGGLAMFLYGMSVMGGGLEKMSGGKLERILESLTSNPFKAVLLGAGVTAVIQSSSATTVMVVGFVNSGIMKLSQAIGIIMGANIGTTITSWLLSLTGIESSNFLISMLKPSSFSPILALIGIIMYMSGKDKKKDIGEILLGFAILMFGMETMSDAVKPLADVPEFTDILTMFNNPVFGVLAGALLTAVIQSSSASVGILQALSVTGAFTYGSVIPIILGQNIGTCVTAMISAIGANRGAKRTAFVHLYFNIIGTLLFLTVFYIGNAIFRFEFVGETVGIAGIALIHSIFNVFTTVVLFPFIHGLEKLAYLTIPESDEEKSAKEDVFAILDERFVSSPAFAIEQCKTLVNQMAEITKNSFIEAMECIKEPSDQKFAEVIAKENRVDVYDDKISAYLTKLNSGDLSYTDSLRVTSLLHCLTDFERISDHAVNVVECVQQMQKEDRFPEFYERLQALKVSVIPCVKNGIFLKKVQTFNNSIGSLEQGGNLIVQEQWLEKPEWLIYVLLDCEESEKLAEMLEKKQSIYIPYLGKNDHSADILEVERVEVETTDPAGQRIDSLFPEESFLMDELEAYSFKYRETLPVGLKEETNQYEYRKFAFSDEIVEEAKQTVFQVQGKNIIFY